MKKYAVIVAGGTGTRMGGGIPKQFRSLCGRPVLWWSMKAFKEEDPATHIIIVLPKEFISLWNDFFSTLPLQEQFEHDVVSGGETRTASVQNGLSLVNEEDSLIAVHDAARPLVNKEIISRGWKTAAKEGAAVPVVPVTDSLRHLKGEGSEAVDRKDFVAVQTPQIFITAVLKDSYSKVDNQVFTDDASVVEKTGRKIVLFEGSNENFKITNPKDMAIAAVIMGKDA